ncbi:glycosyltransferase family 2 protein [Streptacidiphilus jiangxiensis]|uniref:Dolichol-phosphate mannosyltransferase n=1 Tax=Streptacidiphilus jiangxiensis TaxID=235985 RepID=A0A1H7LWR3_STRJI|nr:glycosyltransferase family 2 protein [Streptacidiphilus jiangxiensis]SEL03384.1 dolichol-phosphate mannosyltransferase [Streptacidiphilus jiangxiensis]
MSAPAAPLLSVVIPIYNEQDALPLTVQRLRPILDGIGETYEVVGVDDGSTDDTAAVLTLLQSRWPQLRVVRLRRNSGHQAALTAGLHRALGQYVVSIDADLQDPPEKIVEMLALAREGYDIVQGVRDDRSSDTFFKRSTAGAYYSLMHRLVGREIPKHAGDYRLLSRAAVDALTSLPEAQPVYRLLVPWLGFRSTSVTFQREERVAGSTKYPLSKMVRLAVDSITNFSAAPLRLATWMGLGSFVLAFFLGVYTAIEQVRGVTVPGWSSLFVAVVFFGAVQLVCVGLLGEYVGRIYSAVQGRPAYFIGSDSADLADVVEVPAVTVSVPAQVG